MVFYSQLTIYNLVPENFSGVACIAIDREHAIMSCPIEDEGRPECDLVRLSGRIGLKSTDDQQGCVYQSLYGDERNVLGRMAAVGDGLT